MAEDDGFLSRWSRRKQLARTGQTLPEVPPAEPAQRGVAPASGSVSGVAARPATAVTPGVPSGAAPAVAPRPDGALPREEVRHAPAVQLPTMDDVAGLTPDADFSKFVAQGVPSDVKNAALKKLFADPRFNVMDGMDVYIDDYSQPNPLPVAMARKLASAQFMKLFDQPEEQAAAPRLDGPSSVPETSVPQAAAAAPGVSDTAEPAPTAERPSPAEAPASPDSPSPPTP